MANRSRLSIAKSKIEGLFSSKESKIYSLTELYTIFSTNRNEWLLAQSTTAKEFIEYLINRSKLKKIVLDFPGKPVVRFLWGEESSNLIFDVAMSIARDCYLSHYTAMFINGLTEQIPKNIYVTVEQSPKSPSGELSQESIDEAFKKPPRLSSNMTGYKGYKITLLNGMFTGQTGIVGSTNKTGTKLRVTNVERTLIDIAVRPTYSGGVFEVFNAFKLAKDKVSINKLKAYLKKINFVYPYHQVIGFYLDKAGYQETRIKLLQGIEMNYDFYLTHEMKDVKYSKKWRLYYPKAIDNMKKD